VNLGRLPEHAISLRQGATHMLIQINEGRFGSFSTEPAGVAYHLSAPKATKIGRRCDMSRWANGGHRGP
jgi:hypothetical protein